MAHQQPSNDTPQLFIVYREGGDVVISLEILLKEARRGFPGVGAIHLYGTDNKRYSVWCQEDEDYIDEFLEDMSIYVIEGKTFVEMYAVDLEIYDPFDDDGYEAHIIEFCVVP